MRRLLGMALVLGGCSLGRYDYQECSSNLECREAFGWGSICGAEALCETTTLPARCPTVWPEDLFSNREAHLDDIVFGSTMDLSAFEPETKGFRLAMIQATENEGLEGRDFGIIECSSEENFDYDNLSQDEANVYVAEYLANEIGVPAILGPDTSGRTEAAFLAVEQYGTFVISASATSPALTELDGSESTESDPGLLWRTAPPDSLQGRVMALYLERELLAQQVAVVYQEGPYGEGLQEAFYDNFANSEGVTLLPFINSGDIGDLASQVGTSGVEQVIFISSEKSDVSDFLVAAATISAFEGIGIFLADGAYDTAILEAAASAEPLFDQVFGTRPTFIPGGVYDSFAAAYAAEYDGADAGSTAFAPYAYDAAWLAVYGAAWSEHQEGGIHGLGIARGMRKISNGDEIEVRPTSWNAVKARFESGERIDVVGASGSLDYDPSTGETSAPIEVWGVDTSSGFGFYTVETYDPVSGKPIEL